MRAKHCWQCGKAVSGPTCRKCDGVIAEQTDGSTDWVDIAHAGQTVKQALQQLDMELQFSRAGLAKHLGLIVGNGKIRDEVLARLGDFEFRGEVLAVITTDANPGQILVQIKP